MTIDTKKVHKEIRIVLDLQKEIKARNKRYREDYRFQTLSYKMTILCSILAKIKGRTHVHKLTKRHGEYGFCEPVEEFTAEHQDKLLNQYDAKKIVEACLKEEVAQVA